MKGIGEATVTATAGSITARVAATVVRRVAGRWSGTVKMMECTRQSGPGRNPCVTGIVYPLELTFVQAGPALSGELATYETVRGPVGGSIDARSHLDVTGVITYGDGATMTIDRWDSAVDEAAMTGSFDVTHRFGNAFGEQVLKETFAILDCSRK
jgi:hypothetical protein